MYFKVFILEHFTLGFILDVYGLDVCIGWMALALHFDAGDENV